jgi:hypothetical protein
MCTVKRFFKSTVMICVVHESTVSHCTGTIQEPRTMWRCVEPQKGLEYWWQASVDTTQHGFSVRWLVGYGVKFEVGRKILEGKKMPCQLGVYKKRNQNPFLRSQSIPRYECKCCDRLISWCVLFKLVVIPSIYTLSGWPLASTYSKIYRFTTPLCQKNDHITFLFVALYFPAKKVTAYTYALLYRYQHSTSLPFTLNITNKRRYACKLAVLIASIIEPDDGYLGWAETFSMETWMFDWQSSWPIDFYDKYMKELHHLYGQEFVFVADEWPRTTDSNDLAECDWNRLETWHWFLLECMHAWIIFNVTNVDLSW